ncbi:MAG: response regulator [Candidatus Sulfotelmatobacter sp.]
MRGSETILLVEDEAFVREVAAEILQSAGYRLLVASDATSALELYRTCCEPIDLLLTDIILPGMSGRELAQKFESLCPRSRALLMSGHEEQFVGERFRQAEARLSKPFTMFTLLRKVREVLDAEPLDIARPRRVCWAAHVR